MKRNPIVLTLTADEVRVLRLCIDNGALEAYRESVRWGTPFVQLPERNEYRQLWNRVVEYETVKNAPALEVMGKCFHKLTQAFKGVGE